MTSEELGAIEALVKDAQDVSISQNGTSLSDSVKIIKILRHVPALIAAARELLKERERAERWILQAQRMKSLASHPRGTTVHHNCAPCEWLAEYRAAIDAEKGDR